MYYLCICFRFINSTSAESNSSLSLHKCPYTGYIPSCGNIEQDYSYTIEMQKYKPPDSGIINCTTDLTSISPVSKTKQIHHASPIRATRDFHCVPEYGRTDGIQDSLHDHGIHDSSEHHAVAYHLSPGDNESVTPVGTGYSQSGRHHKTGEDFTTQH